MIVDHSFVRFVLGLYTRTRIDELLILIQDTRTEKILCFTGDEIKRLSPITHFYDLVMIDDKK